MTSVCDVFFYHAPFKHIFTRAFNLYPVWKKDFRGGVLVAYGDLIVYFLCILQVNMALSLSSPSGYAFDEDEEMAVFESTAAVHGGPSRPRLPEISVISPGLNSQSELVRKSKDFGAFVTFPFQFSLRTVSISCDGESFCKWNP